MNSLTDQDEMAVLCILSHGKESVIYGSDGKVVQAKELINQFSDRNCPQMKGKPKMVIIQACQGGKQ